MQSNLTKQAIFKQKLSAVHGDDIILKGKYVKSSEKTTFFCNKCDSEFSGTPNNVLRCYQTGCSNCLNTNRGQAQMSARAKGYSEDIANIFNGLYKVVGDYAGAKTPIAHECVACGFHVMGEPNATLSNKSLSCPKCTLAKDSRSIAGRVGMGMPFKQAVAEAFPELKFHTIGKTVGSLAEFTCRECEHREKRKIQGLRQCLCSACGYKLKALKKRLTPAQYQERVYEKHGNAIQINGKYITQDKSIRHRCMRCFHSWKAKPIHILTATIGCPKCVWEFRKANISKGCVMREVALGSRVVRVQGYEPQALRYMVDEMGFDPDDIVVESEGGVPTIPYKVKTRQRRYYPDMYIKSDNAIIEVKSAYTMGLGTTRKHKTWWNMNCAKAKACHAQGFKFAVLVMAADGTCTRLPKRWAYMPVKLVMQKLKEALK